LINVIAAEHIDLIATGYGKLTLMRVSVTGSHLHSALIITGKIFAPCSLLLCSWAIHA